MNHEQFVASARKLSNLPRDGPDGFFALKERTCNFDYQPHSTPAVSG
jgi:hypothetical protein